MWKGPAARKGPDRRYPAVWGVPVVANDEWMSFKEAERSLGFSSTHVWLLAGPVLQRAQNEAGDAGVVATSVVALGNRRDGASWIKRAGLSARNAIRIVAFYL